MSVIIEPISFLDKTLDAMSERLPTTYEVRRTALRISKKVAGAVKEVSIVVAGIFLIIAMKLAIITLASIPFCFEPGGVIFVVTLAGVAVGAGLLALMAYGVHVAAGRILR